MLWNWRAGGRALGNQNSAPVLKKVPSFFFKQKMLFILYVYECSACKPAGQKRASDPIIDGCEPPCGC